MKIINKQTNTKDSVVRKKQRSYGELVEFLNQHWSTNLSDTNLTCIKKLDKIFNNVSTKTSTILIGGTNGKSLTINFTAQLIRSEGLSVGAFYTPHILTYNERFFINNETISTKVFTEYANEVINTVESEGLKANSFDILTMMALLIFKKHNVDVVVLEANNNSVPNATAVCQPKITAITRVTNDDTTHLRKNIENLLLTVKKNTYVVSADQSKSNLNIMMDITEKQGGVWAMPIRKLAPLQYPLEQLHGRSAALAERITSVFVNNVLDKKNTPFLGTLVTKHVGQRGRPTLEAKRASELNPKKTIEQFWKGTTSTLPGRFQLLEKEKPTILLDNAYNLDAFKNLLLGIRLLHYQRPLKGLVIIIGNNNQSLDIPELLKALRYFFKKTSGQVLICPVKPIDGDNNSQSWDIEAITNSIKGMKVNARSCKSFKEAFEAALNLVDKRHGLITITGGTSVMSEYWQYKGIKKI